ncbi:hypothetical protein [Bartonella florencae]|uniref:hypothetical protein n=1 Tax=Bartonella florencae TaxID=928210 RepID=UPI0005655207|nr:hypothetical protein [Bartonella florencae]
MIVSNFIMLSVACTPFQNPTAFSTVVMQESLDGICVVNDSALLHQPLLFEKAIAKPEYEQNRHNFGKYWQQTDHEDLKYFHSFFSTVVPFKNFKVVQAALTHCCEQSISHYNIKRAVLNFYNTENFKNDFVNASVQKVASQTKVKAPVVDGESQEAIKLQTRDAEQIIKLESPPLFSAEDAFTHKASGVFDAFTEKDSSFEKLQE